MNLTTAHEAIKLINEKKIVQTEIELQEDENFYNLFDILVENGWEVLKEDQDVEKHRWYETSLIILRREDEYIGIRKIQDIFSESMPVEDVYHTIEAVEVEPVTTTVYKEV